MAKGTCSVEGCERVVVARGWCSMHYQRWLKIADPSDRLVIRGATCSVDGCERHATGRRLCPMHYHKWQRYGDPTVVRQRKGRTVEERVREKLMRVDGDDGCDLWQGSIFPATGYGQVSVDGKAMGVHKVVWELAHGPVPDGLYVCHHCDIRYPKGDITYRRCGRLEHLWLGTAAENMADASRKGRLKRRPPD